MPDQIFIGNFSKGLKTDRLPFNIDNDAFPYLKDFYVWRGRVKRKRGTKFLGQLTRQIQSVAAPNYTSMTPTPPWQFGSLALVAGAGNLITGPWQTNLTAGASTYTLETTSTIVPGSLAVIVGANTYTDANQDGILTGLPAGTGTINYATGAITISGGGIGPLTGKFSYFPGLPVMGLEDFAIPDEQYPVLLAFDTRYAYRVVENGGNAAFYLSSYYKSTNNPVIWSGQDYQQFWTTNYSGALWATNNKKGFHFVNGTYVSGSGTTAITFTFTKSAVGFSTLIVGDVLWFNEWGDEAAAETTLVAPGYTQASGPTTLYVADSTDFVKGEDITITGVVGTKHFDGIVFNIDDIPVSGAPGEILITLNHKKLPWQEGGVVKSVKNSFDSTTNNITGTVSSIVNAVAGTYVVTFASKQTVGGTGIAQLLTNSIAGQDGIKWYDGDSTSNTGLPTSSGVTSEGWVNFSPPLTALTVSIDNLTSRQYYLVGALAILPFKDRLLFFSPWIESTDGTAAVQLIDTVLWSWDGTPYYTQSEVNNASLVPAGETADPTAYYVDQTGKGGYLPAGISAPIMTVNTNEDVIMIGFGGDGRKTRFVYTGNDLQPFLFYSINQELPSSATFSAISMDNGVIDIGQYGIAMTSQQSSQRIDLQIPDAVFNIQALNHGVQRVNAIRDFFREWIYFSYPLNTSKWKFPTNTFLFNYRDNTWSILYENWTRHGSYRPKEKKSWLTTGYNSWNDWKEPWNSGSDSPLFANMIAGNPQGYVLKISEGTQEGKSGTILAMANSTGITQITSINHCVNVNDYLYIQNALGTTSINDSIGKVVSTPDADTFLIDLPFPSGTYLGLGAYTRLCQPLLQTKQFPFYWEQGRQTRLGVQKYLMDYTDASQCTVNIYLSQDPVNPWNDPYFNGSPGSLEYSQILFTCPESTNLGLTPFNTNLQMPLAINQFQIWHRINTSLQGDSVQIGITLSDTQMRNLVYATDEITLHGIQLTVSPGPLVS